MHFQPQMYKLAHLKECCYDECCFHFCHTSVLGIETKASIRVPRMFKSHVQRTIWWTDTNVASIFVTPRFWELKPKPLYVCPGCSNHMYNEQYGEQIQYLVKIRAKIFTKQSLGLKEYYKQSNSDTLSIGVATACTTRGEACLVFVFWFPLVLLIWLPTFGSI
jgi:hypothetical protein